MRFFGGKSVQAPHIATVIDMEPPGTVASLFCGACSVEFELARRGRSVIACDGNLSTILFWQCLQDDPAWRPAEPAREDYEALRHGPDSPERFWSGHAMSFSGKWFGSHSVETHPVGGAPTRNVHEEGIRGLDLITPLPANIEFHCRVWPRPFSKLPQANIYYLDPPYRGAVMGYSLGFRGNFWRWARRLPGTVFVSEYSNPLKWSVVQTHVIRGATGNKTFLELLLRRPNRE